MRYIIIVMMAVSGLVLLFKQRIKILNMLLSFGLLRKLIVRFIFSRPQVRSRVMAGMRPSKN